MISHAQDLIPSSSWSSIQTVSPSGHVEGVMISCCIQSHSHFLFLLLFLSLVPSPFLILLLSLSTLLFHSLFLFFFSFLSLFLFFPERWFACRSHCLIWLTQIDANWCKLIICLQKIWGEKKRSMIGKHCRTQRSGAKHSTANIRLMLTAIFGLTLYSSEVRTVRTDDVPPLTSHNTTPLHRSIIFYSLRYYTNSVFECYLFLLSLPNIFVQYFFPHFSFLLFCFASCFFFPFFPFFCLHVIVLCLPLSRISISIRIFLMSTIMKSCQLSRIILHDLI